MRPPTRRTRPDATAIEPHSAVVARLDRATQYAAASRPGTDVSGILDHPLSRVMTSNLIFERGHHARAVQTRRGSRHQFRSPPHRPVGAQYRSHAGNGRSEEPRRIDERDAALLDPPKEPARSRPRAERDGSTVAYGR